MTCTRIEVGMIYNLLNKAICPAAVVAVAVAAGHSQPYCFTRYSRVTVRTRMAVAASALRTSLHCT